MHTSLLRIAVLAFIAALAGSAYADQGQEEGQKMFGKYCSACHGMSATGRGPAAEAMDPRPADLTRIAARRGGEFPEAKILAIIDGREPVRAHGAKQMPVWGEIFRGEMDGAAGEATARGTAWLIIRYLKTVQVPAE